MSYENSFGFGGTGGGAARPVTTGGGGTTLGLMQTQIAEGNFTASVYTMIRDGKFDEAIDVLNGQLEGNFPNSRAALALLAYCYYNAEMFSEAASTYEQLVRLFPGVTEYASYHAQSLYKAGLYADAHRVACLIDTPETAQQINKLKAAAAYEQDEITQAKSHLERCHKDDPDVVVLQGCIALKEELYEEALQKFNDASSAIGSRPEIAYNIALAYYRMRQYAPSLQSIADVIERGLREHYELSIGGGVDGAENTRSVGNTKILRESCLVESFNLKASIEFMLKNYAAANEALLDMPPRSQEELDPVTLHNTALMCMDQDPTNGFKKFNYLLQHPPFPAETFQNLLLFYIKYQYFDLAADVLADNPHLSWQYLSQRNQPLYDFLDGMITTKTAPAEAFRKFDTLIQKHVEQLRKLTKKIQEAKQQGNKESIKKALKAYDQAVDEYIPVLMAQAKIYWDLENYPMVEKIFRQSAEFASEHEAWKLNVAHVFFMQQTKFREAIRYYEPVVDANAANILNCSAIVLANLCVAYIMTAANEKAEEVMRSIEREEERLIMSDPQKQPLHLCIVNLVIGTLYCAKGNYEFGISRVIRSLEPYQRKIMTDTWFYAKRCFLAVAGALSRHMTTLKDATMTEILNFLDQAAVHGAKVMAVVDADPTRLEMSAKNTVKYEARVLKKLFLQLRE